MKRAAILAGLVAGAVLMTASAALAHDDDDEGRGWKRGHWRHHHHDRYIYVERSRPVFVERPVIYREYREVPMYPYYPPGPPSLNINIPLR
ncbi:hypothetical protein [Reyranella sp.]|uniref:hypothetical protein n=1 Tax=Reyranella sp. TaxID=1929291 RepID=UPI0025D9DCC1|nr:hypothetical protein [Reyranella sp.]